MEGVGGGGSQVFAAHIGGLSRGVYLRAADPCPHNPRGEISMGFKLENRRSAMAAEQLMAVDGLCFAEPGPSDNGWSHLQWGAIRGDLTPAQRAALPASQRLEEDPERIRPAAKADKIKR